MHISELDNYRLTDAVKFHSQLNPGLWDSSEHLRPEVRKKLLQIAADFQEFLGLDDLEVTDITLSGSNAAYTYTPHSDIDLHLVVRKPEMNSEVYQELFNAKKYQYNDTHNIRVRGADVELYVQPQDQPHHSQGIYSVRDGQWLQVPRRIRANIDQSCVQRKVEDLHNRIRSAVASKDGQTQQTLWNKIKTMRQTGLEQTGEFGCDNLVFKMLRTRGSLDRLKKALAQAQDRALSLTEKKRSRQRRRWGYGGYWAPGFAFAADSGDSGGDSGGESMREGHQGQPYSSEDGVAASTQMFLNETNADQALVKDFIQHTAQRLGIERMPKIHLHSDDEWAQSNHSFGMYQPETHELHVNMADRHIMDILRTTAHELVHCRQHEISPMPASAGDTGSPWENQAHALAGEIMRDWADSHPDLFDTDKVEESASGYIPKNRREAALPQYAMALSVDIQPGEVGRQANKLALKTGRNGEPGLLMKSANLQEGRVRDLNDPLGPETPPTMPAGTVRVDVSDVYDWYKLGQHISNMKGLGRHDFGKGPPSSIISFGDEETEHKFIQDLAATGLDVTDIDPRDPKQPPGMGRIKTDPTYNVAEADAARTAKSAIDQTEVFGVRGYRARCLEPGCKWHSRSYDRIKQAQDSAKKHAAAHIKQGVAEGAMKDLDIDLQDQQWDAIVGYVVDGLKNNMDIGRMELNLYQYAGQEMFDVDQELENRGFRDLADLAAHIKQNNGRYVPPRDFDLGEDTAEGDLVESLRREFELLEDEFIGEIRMSPSNLRSEAAKTGALAGMEFEMIVPGVKSDSDEMEPDYDSDERCRSIDDAVEFFHDGDYNGRREVERLRSRMQDDFSQWLYEKIDEDWDSNAEEHIYQYLVADVDAETIGEIIGEDLSDTDGPTKQQVAQAAELVNDAELQPYYDDARDRHREEYQDAWDESDWLDDADLDVMSAIENAYDITWPHWTYNEGAGVDVDSVANDFSEAVGMPVNASQTYHGGRREAGHYVIEPDGSLRPDSDNDEGLEFVSPPMPIDQMLDQLKKVREWAGRNGCYTNDSTGLHINVSVPEFSNDQLDYVKLALLLGDQYVLDQFGRSSNTYTKSALSIVQDRVRQNPNTAQAMLDRMRGHMDDLATKAIHSGQTSKYTSINTKEGYIEFRSPGGDWLDENFDKVENTLLRFTVALKAAMDPKAYREEYLKKLYKLLEPTAQGDKGADTVRYFADYVAGKIPAAALRSFVKQAQLQRKAAKGQTPAGQKYWWNVQWDANRRMEVVAANKDEARTVAAKEWGVPTEQLAVARVTMLRPYQEPQASQTTGRMRPTNPDGNYVIFANNSRAGDPPAYRFMAADGDDAETVLNQWRRENPGDWEVHYDAYQRLGQPPVPGSTLDRQRQRAAQSAGSFEFERSQTDIENRLGWPDQTGDANYEVVNRNTLQPVYLFIANTDQDAQRKYREIIDAMGMPGAAENYGYRARGSAMPPVDRQGAQSSGQRPARGGNFTGVWLILDPEGDVIHSFAGVGNVQSDANRVAMDWLRRNPGTMQAGVTVVPEML